MAHNNNSQQNNRVYYSTGRVCTSLTPPLSAQVNNLEQQQQPPSQLVVHRNEHDIAGNRSTQTRFMASFPSASSLSSPISPVDARSEEERTTDALFDKIEDMLCAFMRNPRQHYLHCRVLQWSLDDEITQKFTAVVVINPPIATRQYERSHNF